jgi:two-component system chemotaxis response regulator CheB
MPGLGGLDTLGQLMRRSPRPVVMLSAHDERDGADLTIRALELGAVDFVRKPSWDDRVDEPTLRSRLVQAARGALTGNLAPLLPALRGASMATGPDGAQSQLPNDGAAPSRAAARVVVIGASTGGPRALSELLPALPPLDDAAIVIVQHMPPGFTESLARRLAQLTGRPVREARHGERLDARMTYVAAGGRHVRFTRDPAGAAWIALDDSAVVHGVRPSIDVTLESAVAVLGTGVVAVVLTGMGRDGAAGCEAIRRAGGRVVVQSPASCVVSGMPRATLARAGADVVADLRAMPAALCGVLGTPLRL